MAKRVLEATNKEEAFLTASDLMNSDFCYDAHLSQRAGHPIYCSNRNPSHFLWKYAVRIEPAWVK